MIKERQEAEEIIRAVIKILGLMIENEKAIIFCQAKDLEEQILALVKAKSLIEFVNENNTKPD